MTSLMNLTCESGEIILQDFINPPNSFEKDEVVFGYIKEPDQDAKYKSKLPILYSNELLQKVQKGIILCFQKKPMEWSLFELNQSIRSLLKTDIGDFLVPFYEERILMKGMWLLREEIKDYSNEDLLIGLADTWNLFFRELLPSLQAIMLGVQTYKGQTVKERTLLSFRDEMLLKTDVQSVLPLLSTKSAEENLDGSVFTAFQQMFLVLLSVHDLNSDKYVDLERLAVQLVTPLISARGIFYDKYVPPHPSAFESCRIKKAASAGNLLRDELISNKQCFTLPRKLTTKHSRQISQPAIFLKEMFSSGTINVAHSSEKKLSRSRTKSQSDIL